MLNDKKGVIGKLMSKIPPERREWSFMLAQYVRVKPSGYSWGRH
jgi:hypothetical protein